MANINNFSLVGVGSSVKFGKGGVTVATSGNDLVLSPLAGGTAKIGSEAIATETFVTTQGYLLSSTAASTYLTQANASSTYQTQSGLDSAVGGLGYLKAADISGKADKTYVDSTFLMLSGGTLTGALTLAGAPTADLHAATKKYVDDGLGGLATVAHSGAYADLTGKPVIGTDIQAWDADLDAIAALSGTSGILTKTAANTWSLDTNTYLTTGDAAATYETIANVTSGLATKLNLSGGTMTGDIDMSTHKITTSYTPTAPEDLTNKQYVDGVAAGLTFKNSVMAATTGNIALDGSETAIDGFTLAGGERILVKDQTDAKQNGIYVASITGAWARSSDAASGSTLHGGTFVFVQAGTVNHDKGYVVISDDPITIGTTAINWSQYSSTGTVSVSAGTGISVSSSLGVYTVSLADTAVTPGTYGSSTKASVITVDAQGRITAASDTTVTPAWSSITSTPTTVSGYGITDALTTASTFGGDVSGTYDAITLASVGTPVTAAFVKFTTDAKGRVTATTAVTSSDITTALGFTPVNTAGDTMSGALAMGGNKITGLGAPSADTDAATKKYVDDTLASAVAGGMYTAKAAFGNTNGSIDILASIIDTALINRITIKVSAASTGGTAPYVTVERGTQVLDDGTGSDVEATGLYIIDSFTNILSAGALTLTVHNGGGTGLSGEVFVEYRL